MKFLSTKEELKIQRRKIALLYSIVYDKKSDLNPKYIQPLKSYISFDQYCKITGIGRTEMEHSLINAKPVGYKSGTTGYIYVPEVSDNSWKAGIYSIILNNLLYELEDCERLILDFRGNSGGLILSLARGFLPILSEWEIKLVSNNGKTSRFISNDFSFSKKTESEGNVTYENTIPHYMFRKISFAEIIVIVDKNSHSCGEIFPFLLRHYTDAVIYGETSGGSVSSAKTVVEKFEDVEELSFPNKKIFIGESSGNIIVDVDGIPDNLWK